MNTASWWKKPLRVIQFNLQAKDAPLLDPEKIVRETREMHGNTLCINAGGIYAWYPSKVPFHVVNEFMNGRDLLGEIIEQCHKQDIRLFARFDFSLAEDSVYLQKPMWFLRTGDNQPVSRGAMRLGLWRHLFKTCINGGFQNEDVGTKVLEEVLNNYDVDGLFWNGGYSDACWCDICREKYQKRYARPLPEQMSEFASDWFAACNTECMEKYRVIHKRLRPEIPMTRYYFPFPMATAGFRIRADNIEERAKTGDMLCTEAQDILSRGRSALPEWNQPAIRMKMGRTMESLPNPLGIIHTCPGMDWRHTGMPAAEYLYWTAQIPANGGQYWSSITGIPDTNADKRILGAVAEINRMSALVENDMAAAKSVAQVLLLCDKAGKTVHGWTEALMRRHIQFDMLASYQVSFERISAYAAVIAPEGYPFEDNDVFAKYVENGGCLLVEGVNKTELLPVLDLLGVNEDIVSSEPLLACYMRLAEGHPLLEKIGDACILPLRGIVGYCTPKADANVLSTFIPPFAPFDSVGAPPERASLPAAFTDIPLCVESRHGKGTVLFLPFQAARMVQEYGMEDNVHFLANCVEVLSGEEKRVWTNAPQGVQLSAFESEAALLFHLVNGIGQRPLAECIPCRDIAVFAKIPKGKAIDSVESVIEKVKLEWSVDGDVLTVAAPLSGVWNMVKVRYRV